MAVTDSLRRRLSTVAALAALSALSWLTLPLPALAVPALAAPTPAPSGVDFSLTVSPARLVVAPGHIRQEQRFQVTNKGGAPVDVVVTKSDFQPGQDGTMVFASSAPYSASGWISATPGHFRLAAQASQTVRVRVAVPTNAEPGDHQVALVFLVPAAGNGANIRINRGVGVPIYVTAPGPIDASVRISELRVPHFSFGGPLTFDATVNDTGTIHHDFLGTQRLAVEVDGERLLLPDFTVLRGATRQVSARWEHPPLLCWCRATISIAGPAGTLSSREVTVVILPLRLMLGGVIAIFAAVLAGRLLRRHYQARVRAAAAALAPQLSIVDDG